MHRELGNQRGATIQLANLGDMSRQRGDLRRARDHLEAALSLARDIEDPLHEAVCLRALSMLHAAAARTTAADRCFSEGETLFRDIGHQRGLASLLAQRAMVLHRRGDEDNARATLAQAEQAAAEVRVVPESAVGRTLDEARRLLDEG